jgi:hypothetical protein
MHFLVIKKKKFFTTEKVKNSTSYHFLKTFLMNNTDIFLFDLTQILISKKFEKEIVFESSVLAWIRIRIEQKCWIRIRILF